MQTTTQISRQGRACGYEPPAPRHVQVKPWWPPEADLGYDFGRPTPDAPLGERAPTICIGYTRTMPEVIEVARARLHWDKGQLGVYCDGEQPTEVLRNLIEVIDAEYHGLELYEMTPVEKGGGMATG